MTFQRAGNSNVPSGTGHADDTRCRLDPLNRRLGFPAPCAQDEFGVAVRLLASLEDQVARRLEGDTVETGRHRADERIAPRSSQFARCWLEMRSVARSSIRPTSWMSGTLEQPTP